MSLQTGSPWAGGNPPFMQQGTVDWVAFGNTIWSASSAVLQRFAAAGIQPVTYGAGIALSSQLHLDRVGQSRMEKAIGSLSSVFGLGKVLWFGFGYQSFVHTMAETVAGIKCLAICSCLAEAHSETLAAWVLSELWRVSAFPEQYEPSHAQFLALVKASAGVVSRSEFGKVLDIMLGNQLWSHPVGTDYSGHGVRDLDNGTLEASNAKDIASALHRLFQISRGEADHIVVNGGVECAFIAAIASWLLNLKVRVENMRGDTLLDDTLAGGTVQVFIRYGRASSDAVQVVGTTYILGSCHDIIGRIPDKEDYPLIVRTPWSSCLARVFGSKFTELSNMPHLLGDYLGGVARVYEALATGASDIANLSRKGFVNFSEASYGHGFIDTIISTFPELENIDGFRDCMSHVADETFDDAMRSVESSIIGLESLCSCHRCSQGRDSSGFSVKTSRHCIVGVAYAIRQIALVMSCVVQDVERSGLLPTINGLSAFSALGKQPVAPSGTSGMGTLNSTSAWTRASFYRNAFGLHHDQTDDIFDYHPLASPALLFQGSRSDVEGMSLTETNLCTAVSRGGICCFIEALRTISPRAEMICKVHVLPGHIQYRERRYDFVHDAEVLANSSWSFRDVATLQQPSTDVPKLIRSSNLKDVQVLATERSSGASISFVYVISLPESPGYICPGNLTERVLSNSGLIACDSRGCRSSLAFPCSVVDHGWRIREFFSGVHSSSQFACCIWTYDDDIARCVAMASSASLCDSRGRFNCGFQEFILRRHECLPCSTRSILGISAKKQTSELVFPVFHII